MPRAGAHLHLRIGLVVRVNVARLAAHGCGALVELQHRRPGPGHGRPAIAMLPLSKQSQCQAGACHSAAGQSQQQWSLTAQTPHVSHWIGTLGRPNLQKDMVDQLQVSTAWIVCARWCTNRHKASWLLALQAHMAWQRSCSASSQAHLFIAYESADLNDPGLQVGHPPVSVHPRHGDESSCGTDLAGMHHSLAAAGTHAEPASARGLHSAEWPDDKAGIPGGNLNQHACPTHRLQQGAVQFVVHAHAVAEWLVDRVTRPVIVAGGHARRIWLAGGAQEDTL